MKRLNGTETKALLILSIVAPVGLLAAFRLTGILEEPITISESITVEAVSWNMTRPTETGAPYRIALDLRLENSYADGKASVGLGAHIVWYHENDPLLPFDGNDGLSIGIVGTSNASQGFIHSILVKFSQASNNAFVDIFEDPDAIELYEVRLAAVRDRLKESSIEGYGVNQSKHCEFRMLAYWVFLDAKNNLEQSMAIDLEIIHFDGASYRKIITPMLLKVST